MPVVPGPHARSDWTRVPGTRLRQVRFSQTTPPLPLVDSIPCMKLWNQDRVLILSLWIRTALEDAPHVNNIPAEGDCGSGAQGPTELKGAED